MSDIDAEGHKIKGGAPGTNPTDFIILSQLTATGSSTFESLANLAALAAVDVTGYTTTSRPIQFVRTLRAWFYLDKTSALTADGITIVTALGGTGRWIRLQFNGDLAWQLQTTWYWNPSTGDDENDGATSGTAFKTHEEFFRRTNGLNMGATIIVLADVPNQVMRVGIRGSVSYKAVLIPIASSASTFTSRPSDRNPSTNTPYNLTDTSIAVSWTAGNGTIPYVNKLLVARNAGVVVGTCFVDFDAGSKTMRPGPVSNAIPVLVEADAVPVPTAAGTLSSGNTYVVYDFIKFAPTSISVFNNNTQVAMYGLNCTGASFTPSGMLSFVPTHCFFNGTMIINGPRYQPHQCINNNTLTINSMIAPGFPHFHIVRTGLILESSLWNSPDEMVFSGGGFFVVTAGSVFNLNDLGVFDGVQVQAIDRSFIYTVGYFWGNNNGISTVMLLGISGNWWIWNALKPPTVTGNATPIFINGVGHPLADIIAGPITYPYQNSGITAGGT